jgi:NAD(P)-dependent dehydrogenase (short-subunit alcohol dehydrogenase family)
MDAFENRVAVITGGAAGIGRAMARAFAKRGARLVLADIDEAALAATGKELSERGTEVRAVPTDVTERARVIELAEATYRHFGATHILCNNAGIAIGGSLVQARPVEWETAMAINFWGVVHGIDAFLPRMIEQADGAHIVNTASMAGLVGMQGMGIYCATKFAVVGLSESLQRDLREYGIGVSVLCPMIVDTDIGANSARMLGLPPPAAPNEGAPGQPVMRGGITSAEDVAARVVRGIERGDLYIFTHPEQREFLARRAARQEAMFGEDF